MEENKKKMDKNTIIKLVCGAVILVSLIVIVVMIFKNSITASEYNEIEFGMTYKEVVEIVGCEGECVLDSGDIQTYSFKGVTYFLNGSNATFTFMDGELTSAAQIGLIF